MAELERKSVQVLVVGAGPAGLSAAVAAAKAGSSVCLVDDNPEIGGQIWRGDAANTGSQAHSLAQLALRSNVEIWTNTQVLQAGCSPNSLLLQRSGHSLVVEYERLILATGARERFVPFPGWTLPNVFAAGGLQALVKTGLPIEGKRVAVAGSGPLLLAVAAYLAKRGALVQAICEQASWGSIASFASPLLRQPRKGIEALSLWRQLRGIPLWHGTWPVRAHGNTRLESVVVSRRGKLQTLQLDYLACGFHLVPNLEIPALLGLKISGGFVAVDQRQQTSVPNVFCAGELTGIGGLDLALASGEIAGHCAATGAELTPSQLRKLQAARRFAQHLDSTFALRSELRQLPEAETIVCRCEDVAHGHTRQYTSWRDAKNQTRCGMGPCQGRICGPAVQFLYGWEPGQVRPPVFPVSINTLAALSD